MVHLLVSKASWIVAFRHCVGAHLETTILGLCIPALRFMAHWSTYARAPFWDGEECKDRGPLGEIFLSQFYWYETIKLCAGEMFRCWREKGTQGEKVRTEVLVWRYPGKKVLLLERSWRINSGDIIKALAVLSVDCMSQCLWNRMLILGFYWKIITHTPVTIVAEEARRH